MGQILTGPKLVGSIYNAQFMVIMALSQHSPFKIQLKAQEGLK